MNLERDEPGALEVVEFDNYLHSTIEGRDIKIILNKNLKSISNKWRKTKILTNNYFQNHKHKNKINYQKQHKVYIKKLSNYKINKKKYKLEYESNLSI